MTGEVSAKDLPKFRIVRLQRLTENGSNSKASADNVSQQLKRTEQAVNVTFSANASSKAVINRLAQVVGSPIQREVSIVMEQAARSRKEDVDALAKKVADEVREKPDTALGAIGLTVRSADVLGGRSGT